jgi:hypothetical protein
VIGGRVEGVGNEVFVVGERGEIGDGGRGRGRGEGAIGTCLVGAVGALVSSHQ